MIIFWFRIYEISKGKGRGGLLKQKPSWPTIYLQPTSIIGSEFLKKKNDWGQAKKMFHVLALSFSPFTPYVLSELASRLA